MDDKQKQALALALKTLAMLVNGNFPDLAEELKVSAEAFSIAETPVQTETPKA